MAPAMRALQVTALNCALSQNVDYTSKRVSSSRRPAFALRASMKNGSVAVVVPASIVVLVDGGAANALTGEDAKLTEGYLKVQSAASRLTRAASETFNTAKDVAEQVVHTVKPAVDFVTTYVQQSADYVYRAVFPVAVELQNQAEKAIQSSGYGTKPALEVAKCTDLLQFVWLIRQLTPRQVKYRSILKVQSHQFQALFKMFCLRIPLCWPRELEPRGFCISWLLCSRVYLLLPGVSKVN